MAQEDAYGDPPLSPGTTQQLNQAYVTKAKADVTLH